MASEARRALMAGCGALLLVDSVAGRTLQAAEGTNSLHRMPRRLLQSDGLSTAAIAAIAGGVAGACVLCAVIVAAVCIMRRRAAKTPLQEAIKHEPVKAIVYRVPSSHVVQPNGPPLIQWKDIQLGPEIGLGGMGTVYKGMWMGNRVAVKMVRPDKVDKFLLECLKEEAALMSELLHPSVARVYGLVAEAPHYALVMHYYRRGTVEEFMLQPKVGNSIAYCDLDVVKRLRMALQAAKAMQFLHGRKPVPIVHGDFKTGNLLVDMDGRVVLADFGLARPLNRKRNKGTEDVITAHIAAPEVIANPGVPRESPSDVFAFGVVLLEIMMGRPAYDDRMAPKLIMRNVLRGQRPEIPDVVPQQAEHIIRACWEQDPALRPNANEVVAYIEKALAEIQSQLPQYLADPDTSYL